MVCRWENGEWGGAVFEAGHGAEGEEWGSVELGSAELVVRKEGRVLGSTYGFHGVYGKRGFCGKLPVLVWSVGIEEVDCSETCI